MLRERAKQKTIVTREEGVEYTIYEVDSIVTNQSEETLVLRISDDEWIYCPSTFANVVLAEGVKESNEQLKDDPITLMFERLISKNNREYINYTLL